MKIVSTDQYHEEIQTRASVEAYKCTCHLLKLKDGLPYPQGSGVFVRLKNICFLFTAAHVIENSHNEIFVSTEKNNVYRLGGTWTMNQIENGKSRENDKLDIAIFKLDDESVLHISNFYEFLDESEIGLNHILKPLPYYTGIGFPSSKSKLNLFKMSLKSTPFIFNTVPANNELYNKLGYDLSTNFLVEYDKNEVIEHQTSKKIVGPDSYGMSGGGLWFVDTQLVTPQQRVSKKLVAILIEWPKKNKKVWACTRIDKFIESAYKKYDLK